jgi:hypothetical protein
MSIRPIYGSSVRVKQCPPIQSNSVAVIDYIRQLTSTFNTLNNTYDKQFAIEGLNRIKTSILNEIVEIQNNR